MKQYDVIVIGSGIVGLAAALKTLQKKPNLSLAVLEKENRIATQQTGHNSGVIHSGIYYRPGSLKAKNCVMGVKALLQYCDQKEIHYDLCGKLIIAKDSFEIPKLRELARRGKENGVQDLKILTQGEIQKIEPLCRGKEALYAPHTGIIDFKNVCNHYALDIQNLGGEILCDQPVIKITRKKNLHIQTTSQEFSTKFIINCAGIQADKVAHMSNPKISHKQIIPFRGEYFYLSDEISSSIKGLIYPVPNPKFPFLGVHLTKKIDGSVEAGPNAVLAFSRYGYKKNDIDWRHCKDLFTYKGFWKMSLKYWKIGVYEMYRSLSQKAFLKSLQELAPGLKKRHLKLGGSGVRSQIVLPNGKLIDDFWLEQNEKDILHVLNAPSPAATASLSIGETLSEKVLKKFSS